MTEREYVDATNLKAVRMIRLMLGEVQFTGVLKDEGPWADSLNDDLRRWERKLEAVTGVTE